MSKKIEYINPDGLSKNPEFSHVVTTQGTVFRFKRTVNPEIKGHFSSGQYLCKNIKYALGF